MKQATNKQLRWIAHWLLEQDRELGSYGIKKPLQSLTMGEAGIIIGQAKREIEDMGYKDTESYIEACNEPNKNSDVLKEVRRIISLILPDSDKMILLEHALKNL